MNRTSVKHRAFTVEPMRDKGITSVPGIGSAYSAKLSEAGFSKATNLYGQYLVLDRNEEAFTGWLKVGSFQVTL
ncbi:barrier to autointegration factor [Cooperia oncophora]